MKRVDGYLLTEMLPPFLFGIGAFLAVLVGVELLYDMLRLIYSKGFPVWAAVRISVLELPGMIVLTLPMATMFGCLMAMARLSSDGELVAMRAGGLSLGRIGLPLMLFGLVISVFTFAVNETVVPSAQHQSFEIARAVYGTVAGEKDIALEVRDDDERLERWLYARQFDPETVTLRDVIILDFTLGPKPHLLTAERARWQGEKWVMENVEVTYWDAGHQVTVRPGTMTHDVGRTPAEVERIHKLPEDMSLAELREEAALSAKQGRQAWANRLRQHYHVRLALPWASIGFAVIGLALGVHRQRSSRGIGMGLSLVVIFVFYAISHTLSLVGERGLAHPALIAWTPNVVLYLTGIGLLLKNSR